MNSGMFGVPNHSDRPNTVLGNRLFLNDGPFLFNGKDHSLNGTGDQQIISTGRGSSPTKYSPTQALMDFAVDPAVTNAMSFSAYGPVVDAPWLIFAKTRAVDLNQFALVAADDELGAIVWWASDDVQYLTNVASFSVFVDGTPSTGDIATRYEWYTAKIGAGGVLSLRMKLSNDGAFELNCDDETPFALQLFNRTYNSTTAGFGFYIDNSGNSHASNATAADTLFLFDNQAVSIGSGSANVAPLNLQSKTLKTIAAGGAFEFLNGIFYNSFATSQRGVNCVKQFLSLSATQTATSGSGAQTWFPGGGATTLSIMANITYEFEGILHLANGATTHTTALVFALAGGAAVSAFKYFFNIASVAENTAGVSALCGAVNQAASTVLNATSTGVGAHIYVRGWFRTTAAGTIAPQFNWSANPTGTNQVLANTFFSMWPIGSDTVLGVN